MFILQNKLHLFYLGFLTLGSCGALASCDQRRSQAPAITVTARAYLESIHPNNAARDANKAAIIGDCRLLSVGGWSVPIPIDKLKKYGIREIEGTGDQLYGNEYDKLNEKAIYYAKRYNFEILSNDACLSKKPL